MTFIHRLIGLIINCKILVCILCRFSLYKFPYKNKMEEESITERTKVIGEILSNKFEEIENRALGNAESGIPVCFYDYDAMTQGLPEVD